MLLSGFNAAAQTTVATDPVGYTSLALPANSDTLISLPFTRPVEYTGPISSVSTTSSGGVTTTTITLPGSTSFTQNQFAYAAGTQPKTYYAIIGPLLTSLTGTVSVTNGSTAVTGSGFTPIAQGDELVVSGLAYNVASVTSDTALVLSRAYTGTTATGQTASYDHSPKEGSYYTVTANGTNTLTVNLNGDSLSTVATGTSLSLIPYWTLGTAFPDSDAGTSYIASTGTTTRTFQTRILASNLTTPGINLSPSATYIYYSSAWRAVTTNGVDTANSYDDTILPPTTYFTVRNAATGTTFTPSGGVYMNRLTEQLDTLASNSQDNAVAVLRPTAVTLNDLGLISSGAFVASTGTTTRTIKDELLTYDNTQIGFNKAPSGVYIYYNGAWRAITVNGVDTSTDYGSTVNIPYGTGLTIRKVAATNGATSLWQNTRNY